MISVATIAALKALTSGVSSGDLYDVAGFDGPDGCGGFFRYYSGIPAPSVALDGYVMPGPAGGSWWRCDAGPIHTRWAGIKPTTDVTAFDWDGFASSNYTRWEALNAFCSVQRGDWVTGAPGIAKLVQNGIFIDAGTHDIGEGVLHIGESVTVDGCGPLISELRVQGGGSEAMSISGGGDFGAANKLSNWSLRRFTPATSATEYGLHVTDVVRSMRLTDWNVSGFGTNIRFDDCWEFELDNVWAQGAFRSNIHAVGSVNSAILTGCRMDGASDESGAVNVKFESSSNTARGIVINGGSIQGSQRIGLQLVGVRQAEIRGVQFEANNLKDGYHPDLWVECPSRVVVKIAGNYFTTAGRYGATTNRAISIRNNIPSGSVFDVDVNATGGVWDRFLDVLPNVAMKLRWKDKNDIGSTSNNIPASVLQF